MSIPLRKIVEQATLAPSVHNVQPVRWMIEGNCLVLLGQIENALPQADPTKNDQLLSAGAALEGVVLAASTYGLKATVTTPKNAPIHANHIRLANIKFEPTNNPDPLSEFVEQRASWRGAFEQPNTTDRAKASDLESEDCKVISSSEGLNKVSQLADSASLHFMADTGFRSELVSWMRLRRSNPRWSLDGLNSDAMNMNAMEAFGASIVLGKTFDLLLSLGLAAPIVSEASRYKTAAGLMVVHRPADEDPIEMGRHFYRQWLKIERAGFVANVVAALADDDKASTVLKKTLELPNDRKIVTTFLFGKLTKGKKRAVRARLPIEEFILTP